jgi:hypothetical protein
MAGLALTVNPAILFKIILWLFARHYLQPRDLGVQAAASSIADSGPFVPTDRSPLPQLEQRKAEEKLKLSPPGASLRFALRSGSSALFWPVAHRTRTHEVGSTQAQRASGAEKTESEVTRASSLRVECTACS